MFRRLKPYQLATDVAVAVVFFAVTGLLRWDPFYSLGSIAVACVLSAALALRRLSPGLALLVAWAGAVLQMAMGMTPVAGDIAIFGVLYATAAYGTTLVFWLGFGSSFVGALVIAVYITATTWFAGGSIDWRGVPTALLILIASLFALLLSWTVGALVRTAIRARENRAAQVRAEADTAAEQERVRIARDMHDVVAHSLAVVIAQADGARYAAASDPAAAPAALETISSTARAALADVRLLLTQLRHSQGDGPQPTLADLEGLYAQVRAAGVDLRIDVDPAPRAEVPAAVELAVYRILQEALTNALRHGAGAPVSVALAWHPDRVELAVRNALTDADVEPGAGVGHGLIGMRERAQLAGGRLEAGAEAGRFVVRTSIPIGRAAA